MHAAFEINVYFDDTLSILMFDSIDKESRWGRMDMIALTEILLRDWIYAEESKEVIDQEIATVHPPKTDLSRFLSSKKFVYVQIENTTYLTYLIYLPIKTFTYSFLFPSHNPTSNIHVLKQL